MAEVIKTGEASSVNKPFCKCGDGWSCEITKTDGPSSGKAYIGCRDGSTCEIGAGTAEVTKAATRGEVECECGEGWTCVLRKTDASKAPECGAGGCKC
ncbi:hypothetical protein ACHQM5_016559 [Ranunculus cassubicifolius]